MSEPSTTVVSPSDTRRVCRVNAFLRSLIVAAACTGAGCAPGIHAFRAEPNHACLGTPVTLTWDASRAGTISANPSGSGPISVGSTGSTSITPSQTTRYRIDVSNMWGHDAGEVDVVLPDPKSATPNIGQSVNDPSTKCDAIEISLTVIASDTYWDPHLRVGAVASSDGREYRVEHAGRTGIVRADAATDVFKGVPIAGSWTLTTALRQGEVCGKKVPHNLMVNVFPVCQP